MTSSTASPDIALPALSLVVLVGATGSGKSTFAAQHFGRFEVVSSDHCRALVSDDEADQAASSAAFEVLHLIVEKRLAAGRLTAVDATNVTPRARQRLVELAKQHNVAVVAIVLDVPEAVCVSRDAARRGRSHGAEVVRSHRQQLTKSRRGLRSEGFREVHMLHSVDEVDAVRIQREKLPNDHREYTGPFDVIGDIHGCRSELESLLGALGYAISRDDNGNPVNASHPDGRCVVFVGDLVDRGPDSAGVLRLAMGMVTAGNALAVPGNHENKLLRALRDNSVRTGHGLAETLHQLDVTGEEFRDEVREFCDELPPHLVLDGGNLVIAHAGLPEKYHGRCSPRVRSFALYGDPTRETDEHGFPVRREWTQDYQGQATSRMDTPRYVRLNG